VSSRYGILSLHLLFLGVLPLSGCHTERPTQVRVEGGATPDFILSGSGDLTGFSVYLVSPSDFVIGRIVNSLSDDSFFSEPPTWRIEAQPDWLHGRRVEDIGRLKYGVVPPGYTQKSPTSGVAPPVIISGREYFFHCETTNAPSSTGGFQLNDSKVVPKLIGLPCLEMRSGNRVTVPCNEHHP
jgi:hypothetical protein